MIKNTSPDKSGNPKSLKKQSQQFVIFSTNVPIVGKDLLRAFFRLFYLQFCDSSKQCKLQIMSIFTLQDVMFWFFVHLKITNSKWKCHNTNGELIGKSLWRSTKCWDWKTGKLKNFNKTSKFTLLKRHVTWYTTAD